MKIMSTIAALACSVTLVNAQQSGTPSTPRRPSATTPAPAAKPRVQITEPWVTAPGAQTPLPPLEWTELPSIAPLAPGQTPLLPLSPLEALEPLMAPMALEFPMITPRPGQAPWALETPIAPLPAQAAWPLEALIAPTPLPPLAMEAPMAVELPSLAIPVEPLFPGQGPVIARPPSQDRQLESELRRLSGELDRAERERQRALAAQDRDATREAESQLRSVQRELDQAQREQASRERAIARELEAQDRSLTREQQRVAQEAIRDAETQQRIYAREAEQAIREAQIATRELHTVVVPHFDMHVMVPPSWAPQDAADSVWKNARELFNRGEWGQAVQAFRLIPQRYPNSEYAPEAAYFQAFSLFRIGGTNELREALSALEASRAKYPNARSRTEAASLTARIQGVLAQRGDAQAAAALRATANEAATCDREEQAVQQEAMNQLSRMEGGNINELITRVLARKDECAIPLRRTAIFLVGNRRDAQAVQVLANVARTDPSVDVRVEAIGVISRLASEEGVPVLEELTRSDDERIQRAAIRALVRHPSAKARTSVRGLVERDDVSERVRSEALSAFDAERATAEDVAWLRALYGKVTTPSLKARTLSAIVRVGGPDVDQWLVTLARDDNQPSEIRSTAMRRIGETMSVADLGRLYDSATQQRFRSEIINVLGKRKEDAATDKLIDIIKNGTDPSLRRSAIAAVVAKNDARAQQLLLEIINK